MKSTTPPPKKAHIIVYTTKRSNDGSGINDSTLVKEFYKNQLSTEEQKVRFSDCSFLVDLGDDPSFLGSYLFGGRLTWNVCRSKDRSQVSAGDYVIFFALDKSKDPWCYYFTGYAEVDKSITHLELLIDKDYSTESKYANKIVEIHNDHKNSADIIALKQCERWADDIKNNVTPENSWHADWLWKIADRSKGLMEQNFLKLNIKPTGEFTGVISSTDNIIEVKREDSSSTDYVISNIEGIFKTFPDNKGRINKEIVEIQRCVLRCKMVNQIGLSRNCVVFSKNNCFISKKPILCAQYDSSTTNHENWIDNDNVKNINQLTVEKISGVKYLKGKSDKKTDSNHKKHVKKSFVIDDEWLQNMAAMFYKVGQSSTSSTP